MTGRPMQGRKLHSRESEAREKGRGTGRGVWHDDNVGQGEQGMGTEQSRGECGKRLQEGD